MSEHFKPNEHMKTAELETLLIHGDRAWNPVARGCGTAYLPDRQLLRHVPG
jgi:hypothetical protein